VLYMPLGKQIVQFIILQKRLFPVGKLLFGWRTFLAVSLALYLGNKLSLDPDLGQFFLLMKKVF
jgi:hypothetical protein